MKVEARDRLFAPAGPVAASGHGFETDLGLLIARLLLFDEVVLESFQLREVLDIVRAFGFEGAHLLLSSGALRFMWQPLTLGEVSNAGLQARSGKPRGPNLYAFSTVRLASPADAVDPGMRAIKEDLGLHHKQSKALRHEVGRHLAQWPETAGQATTDQFFASLQREPGLLELAVAIALRRALDRPVDEADLQIEAQYRGGSEDVVVESNLARRFDLGPDQAREIVTQGLLAVGGLFQRFEAMSVFNTLTGFREDEVDLFQRKLNHLAAQHSEASQLTRFRRVLGLRGLPGLDGPWDVVGPVSVENLLEARASPACAEFRRWLRTVDEFADDELRDLLAPIRFQLGAAASGAPGRTLRFIATSALAVAQPVMGTVAGAIDAFLLERLLPSSGPATFLGRSYRSIFEVPPSVTGTT